MKVKAIKKFFDRVEDTLREKGDKFETDDGRGNKLIGLNFVVEDATTKAQK